jgi:hypothetical protein
MLSFSFNNPIEKKIRDYIKLSNDISIIKFKERHCAKPPYKINYDSTFLNDSNKKNNNVNVTVVSFIETIIILSVSFIIYKNI